MEIIKRERELAKKYVKDAAKAKVLSNHTDNVAATDNKVEPIDTSPPPERTTTEISRVPSREELNNKISFIDKNRIERHLQIDAEISSCFIQWLVNCLG